MKKTKIIIDKWNKKRYTSKNCVYVAKPGKGYVFKGEMKYGKQNKRFK